MLRAVRRDILTGLLLIGLAGSASLLVAQDVVFVQDSSGTITQRHGRIVEYTGQALTILHASGREEQIEADRVQKIVTQWSDDAQQAAALLEKSEFAQALLNYQQALRAESRPWAKRQLIAQMIWCWRYTGDISRAGDAFLALYAKDPTTRDIATIPLPWITRQPSLELQRRAQEWLQDRRPAARLLGAAWLLPTAARADALRALRQFESEDARLIFLAEAQQWRVELAKATVETVSSWEQRIEKMPDAIRAGPFFLLGRGWSRLQRREEAALAYLRVPISHARDRDLAAEALLDAGQELEKLERTSQAAGLYREVIGRFSGTDAVDEARRRLPSTEG
jgi:tetratricopeptide (TPR) repeat protein